MTPVQLANTIIITDRHERKTALLADIFERHSLKFELSSLKLMKKYGFNRRIAEDLISDPHNLSLESLIIVHGKLCEK